MGTRKFLRRPRDKNVGTKTMSLYYIATAPYKGSFVILDEDQPHTDVPPGFIISGWPPFECDTENIEILMEAAKSHIAECEYLNLWHIYMN